MLNIIKGKVYEKWHERGKWLVWKKPNKRWSYIKSKWMYSELSHIEVSSLCDSSAAVAFSWKRKQQRGMKGEYRWRNEERLCKDAHGEGHMWWQYEERADETGKTTEGVWCAVKSWRGLIVVFLLNISIRDVIMWLHFLEMLSDYR